MPKDEPIFSERATHISIEDEAAGEFVAIEQTQIGKIHIDITEWPEIKKAIDEMIESIIANEKESNK
jgi:hypothetical protein